MSLGNSHLSKYLSISPLSSHQVSGHRLFNMIFFYYSFDDHRIGSDDSLVFDVDSLSLSLFFLVSLHGAILIFSKEQDLGL